MDRPSRRPLWSLVALVALLAGSMGAATIGASPTAGQDIVDPSSDTTLVVAPGDRTEPGVELTLTAEVVDSAGAPVTGESVELLLDGETIAEVVLDGAGRAQATVAPAQGAHWITAYYAGRNDLMPSFADAAHSVLPETCADQAQPGAGAVVRHAYLVALHRCPDPAGFAYWVARLDGGASAAAAAATLARSPEAVDVVVDDAYRRILDRSADPAGRAVWAARLRAGWATSQLWAALAAAPELAGAGADTDARVDLAFARIVGRPVDPAGHAYWRARLLADTSSSPTWRAMAVTAEAIDGVIDDAHLAALGRAPTSAEGDTARAVVRARRGDWRLLTAELLGRAEASDHAQRYPDPEDHG